MKALIQISGLTMTVLWGSFIPLTGPMGSGIVIAAPAKGPAKNTALQRIFRRGMDAYDAKAFDDAVDLFSQLLQKQADYVPAKIQLARALYQLKRFPEAYKLFQQIDDVGILEPDPSYEFGQSAFRNNDFTNALKAFRNVPNGHPLFDLAGYYGGISAFKLGDYQLSLDLFEQAVVLPSKLLKSQKLYQKEAERLLIVKQKQELQNSIPPNRPSAGADESAEPPKPYYFLNAERRVRLIPKFTSQTQQTQDNRTRDLQVRSGLLDVNLGVDRNGSSAKAPHWAFMSNFSAKGMEGGSDEIKAVADAKTEQEYFVIRKNRPRSMFMLDAVTGVEWAIAPGTSLGMTIGGRGILPGDKNGEGAGIPLLGIFLAQKNNNLETLFKADFYGLLYGNDFLYSNARQLGRIEYQAQNRFHFGLQGELSEFAYNVDRVDGPDWQGRILTEIGFSNEHGFRVQLGGFFEIAEAQRLHDLALAPIIEFNSSTIGATLRSDFTVFKTVDFGLEAQAMERSTAGLGPKGPNYENNIAAMRNAFPSIVTTLSLHFNFNSGF